jgi:hypothetical protein
MKGIQQRGFTYSHALICSQLAGYGRFSSGLERLNISPYDALLIVRAIDPWLFPAHLLQ